MRLSSNTIKYSFYKFKSNNSKMNYVFESCKIMPCSIHFNSNYIFLKNYNYFVIRSLSSDRNNNKNANMSNVLTEHRQTDKSLTMGERVKQAGKDMSYIGIILAGLSVTGIIVYAIFRELFSNSSPNVIYSKTLKKCKSDSRVIDRIGEPIKGFGEMTSRGRRRHVSFVNYEKDGIKHIRVKFYLKGSKRRGTVHCEMKEISKNKFDYRYIFVELDGFPSETIIIQDNRSLTDNL